MRLHINIDHIATVREARRTDEPDPVRAAMLAELAGADGITVHLREDRRHIQDRDVRLLMQTVRTGVNLELAAASDVVQIALELRPMTATLVPERRAEITTEGGLQVHDNAALGDAIKALRAAGVRTSLFIDPTEDGVRASAVLGVEAIELHTGEFAEAFKQLHTGSREAVTRELARLGRAAALGRSLGLAVHAGHGLTYENVARVAAIEEIEELNIGHSIVSRSLFVGMERAVRDMKDIVTLVRTHAYLT
jgi:pyridoxine 5-phosphate synthase